MKPNYLMFIRHAVSLENTVHRWKYTQALYQEFLKEYQLDPNSHSTVILAKRIRQAYALPYSDREMPVFDYRSAIKTGMKLSGVFPVPDIIFTSPYRRTLQTLTCLKMSWRGLEKKKVMLDERLCERDYGIACSYFDRRVYKALCPEERIKMESLGEQLYRYPEGENQHEVRTRVSSWFYDIKPMNINILVVSHYETIRTTRNIICTNIDKDNEPRAIECGVSLYEHVGENWRECLYNTKWH